MVIVDVLSLEVEIASGSVGWIERVSVSSPSTKSSSIMDTLKSKLVLDIHGGMFTSRVSLTKSTSVDIKEIEDYNDTQQYRLSL